MLHKLTSWWEQFLDIWGTFHELSFVEQVLFSITLWCSTFAVIMAVRIGWYLVRLWASR